MNDLRNKITLALKGFDWNLVKGSTLISIGTAVARILGLAFSLVLAAVFTSGEYGEVRYSIAIASIVAIIAMPFGQHVLSRFVSKYRNDSAKLNMILTNAAFILPCLFLLTLLVTIPVLMKMGKFNIGIIAIFFGETLFYAYWGLTSGFLEPRRLTTAYLGSNIIQILLVFVLIKALGIHSTTLALLIYGLSYLLPLTILMVYWPLPGKIQKRFFDWKIVGELLRFSIPIWISHACYTFSVTFDLLFIERFGNANMLGAYSLSKTLASMFIIVPSAIATLLMPKVASSSRKDHGSLLWRMVTITLVIDTAALLVYLPLAQPLTRSIFGTDYLVPLVVSLLLAVYMILYGVHSLMTAVYVGDGKPQIESVSRVVELIFTLTLCLVLIPSFGMQGAAISMLGGKIAGLSVYWLQQVYGEKMSAKMAPFFGLMDRDVIAIAKDQSKNE